MARISRLSRFDCASSSLTLKDLLTKTQRVFWICFGLGVATHLSLTQVGGLEAEQRAAKPLTTQFVKRQPRLTKPLELKKRPQPRRRHIQRKMVSVKARMQRDQRATSFQAAQTLGGLSRPNTEIRRIAGFGSMDVEPRSIASAIEGTKEVEQKIDMSLELLDMDALNTGQYHAMVIQDPEDKRNIQGFCRLCYLFIPRLHQVVVPHTGGTGTNWYQHYVAGPVRKLVDAMNRYTAIDARIGEKLIIDDPQVFRTPWIYLFFISRGYDFSDIELNILGRYLMEGGFIFADSHSEQGMSVASSHRKNMLAVLQTQGIRMAFEILPDTHPIYHCYFDFDGPPDGVDGIMHWWPQYSFEHPDYLEGLEVEGRLVCILSRKGYYSPWNDWGPHGYEVDPTRQFQFGVNLIVFALTQEGSITHQLMNSVK